MLKHKQQMYPKVKVRLHDEQEDQFSPQNDHRSLLLAKVSDENIVKEIQSCSPPLMAKTKKAHVSKLLGQQSISSSKDMSIKNLPCTVENSRLLGTTAKPDVLKSCSVLRPRAVLSSPENDGMIGSINKLVQLKNSLAFKVHDTKERFPTAPRPQVQPKIAPSQVKKAARPMNMIMTKGSNNKALINKNGVLQSNSQKPMVEKQEAGLGIGKPSFT